MHSKHVCTLSQVSGACWELLSRVLQPVPAQRVSIAEVLSHPWVTEGMPHELATLNDRLLQVHARSGLGSDQSQGM